MFLSEIHPRLEQTADDVVDEQDAQAANKRIFEFVDAIIDYLETADEGGIQEAQDDAQSGQGPGGNPNDLKVKMLKSK